MAIRRLRAPTTRTMTSFNNAPNITLYESYTTGRARWSRNEREI